LRSDLPSITRLSISRIIARTTPTDLPSKTCRFVDSCAHTHAHRAWLADGRSKCHATLNFPTSSSLSSFHPRLRRSHSDFFSIHPSVFLSPTNWFAPTWRVFLAIEPVYGVNTTCTPWAKPHTHMCNRETRITRKGTAVSVLNCVWTGGILGGIFIVPSCRCRLNNLRVIANSSVRLVVITIRFRRKLELIELLSNL